VLRFRCHTGHAYTVNTLLAELSGAVEDVLWGALRAVEKSIILLRHLSGHVRKAGDGATAEAFARKAEEAQRRADLVRRAVMQHETVSEETISREAKSDERQSDP